MIVHFDEDSLHSRSHRGGSQGFDELRLTAGFSAGSAGELDAVGCVEDYRIAAVGHDFESPHIDYQVVVAEGGTTFREDDFAYYR